MIMLYDGYMNVDNNQKLKHLGGKNNDTIIVYPSELMKFKALFTLMVLIVDKQDRCVLYESDMYGAQFSKYGKDVVARVIDKKYTDLISNRFGFSLVFEGTRRDYDIELKDVIFNEKECYLGILNELAFYSASGTTDEKITRISNALLNISSTIDIGDDINKTLDLVLAESIKSFEHGHFGTIFVVQDEYFKIISNIGYGDEIINFKLPIATSFLYHATQGKMDRIVPIEDVQKNYKVLPLRSSTGELIIINSTIVAPIFYRGSLYGMMSIDSNKDKAFTQDDLAVMTFIRNNVQALISNQLTFLERTSQALTDNMTGLYNRHFLIEHFNTILERSKRYDEPFSVVVFDLDDLKGLNDHYGHLVGDQMIKSFARSLQQNTRRSDILARYGGDEFMAIYLMADETELRSKFENLNRNMTIKAIDNTVQNYRYNFSYGIATYPNDGDNYADLINAADSRMYDMKLTHKNKGFPDAG